MGVGGPSWWAFRVRMGVLWVRRRRRIWLRVSPGRSRKGKGIGVVGVGGKTEGGSGR